MLRVGSRSERLTVRRHVNDTAGHSGREVLANRPEHDDGAAGHVLAGVIADAFDDGGRAAVADREPLARQAGDEQPSAVAPYSAALPASTWFARPRSRAAGATTISPPCMPLPRPSFVSPISDSRMPEGAKKAEALPGASRHCQLHGTVGNPRSPKRAAIAPAMPAPYGDSVLANRPGDRQR